MTRNDPRALGLVLGAIVSVQLGGALATTLVRELGTAGSVTMRLLFATAIMVLVVRPRVTGHDSRAWRTVIAFGLVLGGMNFAFYASLAHLPIGVAVTIEFIGPLSLAAFLSRRARDLAAVAAAALGVVLISGIATTSWAEVSWVGVGLAFLAGVFWAAYIVLGGRAGAAFPRLDGLALALVFSTLLVLPFGLSSIPEWDATTSLTGLGIAVLSSVLPYSLELLALRSLAPAVFGILLSLEPAVAALAGLLVLGQSLSAVQVSGLALVVVASVIIMGLGARSRADDAETALAGSG